MTVAQAEPSALGLGDTIEKITEATGIKKAVDWFSQATGVDCGCDARKKRLNELVNYRKVECLTLDEYEWLTAFYALKTNRLDIHQQDMISKTHARVFNHTNHKPCTCSPRTWQQYVNDLKAVWMGYEAEQA